MTDQLTSIAITSAVIVALPSAIGILVGRRGDGHLLWVAALVTLLLAYFGTNSLASGRDVGVNDEGPSGLSAILYGYLASFIALLVGLATCAAELVHALRARHFAWVVALLAIGLVPLLTALLAFDLNVGVLERYYGGEPVVFQGELLAFDLLLIGPIALTAYGLRQAVPAWWAQRRAPRVR
jgi:hypothetical protein